MHDMEKQNGLTDYTISKSKYQMIFYRFQMVRISITFSLHSSLKNPQRTLNLDVINIPRNIFSVSIL